MSDSRRAVASIQYAIVPNDVALDTAQPDGSQVSYTDMCRWRTPLATPPVQYLSGDEDVARATAAQQAAASGVLLANLRPGKGPHLLDVSLDQTSALDLTSPANLDRRGLPADYPRGDSQSVRDDCRRVGDALVTSGESLVAVRPTQAHVLTRSIAVAVVGRVAMSVVRRRRFATWY